MEALAQLPPQSVVPRATKPRTGVPGLPPVNKATNDLLQVAPYYQLGIEWNACARFAVGFAVQMATSSAGAVVLALAACSEKTQYLRSLLARQVGVEQADVARIRMEYMLSEATRMKWAQEHPPAPDAPASPAPRP